MKVRVHIERVILDGVPAQHPRLLRQSLQNELAESIRIGGLSKELLGGGARASLRGGITRVDGRADMQTLGAGIARAAYQALGDAKATRGRTLSEKTGPEAGWKIGGHVK